MLFVEYPKCSTCKKAKKWLEEHGFEFEKKGYAFLFEVCQVYPRFRLNLKNGGTFNVFGLLCCTPKIHKI
jgi:hypothetical protein